MDVGVADELQSFHGLVGVAKVDHLRHLPQSRFFLGCPGTCRQEADVVPMVAVESRGE
jgi:hypothetical protein